MMWWHYPVTTRQILAMSDRPWQVIIHACAYIGGVMGLIRSFLLAAAAIAGSGALAQDSDAVRVYSSNGVRVVLQELLPQIEQAIGKKLVFEFSTSRTLTDRIAADEAFDVAILTPNLINELTTLQRVAPAPRNEFARVGVGVGSKQGTPAKSVATLDDLRRTLLEAESVAFGANGQSRRTNERVFETLGIVDAMRRKTTLTGAGEAPVLVGEGEIELVLTLVSELLREPGVQFLGPLPPEVQSYVHFEAAMSNSARDPATAEALIGFLSTPVFIASLMKHGLEPISP
jgi:molybdate transport system substrate-binding protein